ncbi:MAG: Gfo/Idh/MocA family oxidoreductase [Candidatus Neomarinimicrobiota bacterium]
MAGVNEKKRDKEKQVDRRSFLRMTTAAGAGLVLAPKSIARVRMGNSNDLNIALLGVGAQGQILLNACLKTSGIRFKAVCDIWEAYNLKRASGLLRKYGHNVGEYVDYREMLDKENDLDAVIIATPDFWHADQTVHCLRAGLHVYCEKEMSKTVDGARRMVQTARQTGRHLQIGHQRRSNPRYLHCYHKLIKEARILGKITTISGQWNRSAQPDLGWPKKAAIDQATLERYGYESMHEFRNWRWYRHLGGGPVVDLGSHQIDIFNWFLETPPRSVLASGGNYYYDTKTHQWDDTVMVIYEYEPNQGAVKAFYQTINSNSSEGYYEHFMGDQGTLLISEAAGREGIYREPSSPDWTKWIERGYLKAPVEEKETVQTGAIIDVRETMAPPEHKLAVDFNEPYHKPHLENFFDAIRGRANLNCPEDVGYETAVTVLKIHEALDAGMKVEFNPDDFKI